MKRLTRVQMNACLRELRADFGAAEVVYKRANRIVIRWRRADADEPIILKMWSHPDLKGKLRRLLRIASCDHEWRSLKRLERAGMAVPGPLGTSRVSPAIASYTEVLFMEDLGPCEDANGFLKQLVQAGQEQQALRFEDALIDMTQRLLDAGMLDVDHGLANIVVQASGRPVRLDVEFARLVVWPRLFAGMYGQMLGCMIGLHAFAVQPDTGRTSRFAQKLRERLRPPRRALVRAGTHAREMMRIQLQNSSIDTRLVLPWD